MHAFLIVGASPEENIKKLSSKLNAKLMDYPLAKIEDVRNLNNLIRLSFQEPTLIVSRNVHDATEEALNAFLKNLEEPQDNIFFALTTPSIKKVLPTIVSRCEIILAVDGKSRDENFEEIEKFLNLPAGKKLAYIDKIKDRQKALVLTENTVIFLHSLLHENDVSKAWPFQNEMVKYTTVAENLDEAVKTYSRLKGNGNVNLQLVNFSINYKNG